VQAVGSEIKPSAAFPLQLPHGIEAVNQQHI